MSSLSDSGSQFSCLVSNAYGSTNSSYAVLTVVSNPPVPNVAFVRSSAGDPWGIDDDEVILTMVFGSNWQTNYYETVSPAALFTPSTSFIFMEGSDSGAVPMATFLNANLAAMQNWVSNGGSLFLNAAPNEGGNINFGFGVTLLYDGATTFTSAAEAVNPAAPIFNGPFTPVGTNWTGTYFAHGTVSGPGLNPLIKDTNDTLIVLAETSAGLGHVLFGGMTLPYFHSPQPQATNLLANILSYGASQAASAGLRFQTVTLTNGMISFGWSAQLGRIYQLQYKTNLVQPDWINLGGAITASNTVLSATYPIGSDNQRFFRVQQQ